MIMLQYQEQPLISNYVINLLFKKKVNILLIFFSVTQQQSDVIRHGQDVYKNQPGRIENYIPGHSSISEKEAKEVGSFKNSKAW